MPGPYRIAIVGPTHPYKGGVSQHTTELAKRLERAGHDVTLESWSRQYPERLYPGQQQRVEVPEGAPFPKARFSLSWSRPDSWWRLGRQLGDCQDDAVILVQVTPLQVPSYLTIWLATGRRSRRVLLCHNVLPHESRPFDRVLMRLLLRRADAVLVHSESQADLARTLLGRGRTGATPRVEIAALPPHLPAVPTRAVQTAATASRRLLFFGVVRPYKGLDVLLQALATLPEDVTLTVAGEFWDDPRRYERQAERLGLGARVQFRPGYVPAPQIAPLLAEADALVMPYRSATASQNVQLAFAHGLPVVVTRTGALAEQVRPGVNGLLADPNDVASLSRALHRLYEPGVLDHLRANLPTSGGRDEDAWTRYVAAIETLVADTQPIVGLPR